MSLNWIRLLRAVGILVRELPNIIRFGRWGWNLAKRCYRVIENDTGPSGNEDSRKRKALGWDRLYGRAYEMHKGRALSPEDLYKRREAAWRFHNPGKVWRPAGKSSWSELEGKAGKAR